MVITVLTSIQDDFGYYENLAYLRKGLKRDRIQFQGLVNSYEPSAIVFSDKARVYDFTRSASTTIREIMTDYLYDIDVLPLLTRRDRDQIQKAFGPLFEYYTFKEDLGEVGQKRAESMKMLIFNEDAEYTAHVYFNSLSRRVRRKTYTVYATLTCQRFTYFPIRKTDFEDVLEELQNLHFLD